MHRMTGSTELVLGQEGGGLKEDKPNFGIPGHTDTEGEKGIRERTVKNQMHVLNESWKVSKRKTAPSSFQCY